MLTTGNQLKAARALAGVEQLALAEASGVSIGTIRNMEACGSDVLKSSLKTISIVQRALEAAGVEFTNGGEPGVKLRRRTE
jgi:transcriptional regulator with XRE-family HTH domain